MSKDRSAISQKSSFFSGIPKKRVFLRNSLHIERRINVESIGKKKKNWGGCALVTPPPTIVRTINTQKAMSQKLAVKIQGEIRIVSQPQGLDEIIKSGTPYYIIGKVCTARCDTSCPHYRAGTCPFSYKRAADGKRYHILMKEV